MIRTHPKASNNKKLHPDVASCILTIVSSNGQRNLDLLCSSTAERDEWFDMFVYLLTDLQKLNVKVW
jgi:hypothetical protein